jgi:hypothetical protein
LLRRALALAALAALVASCSGSVKKPEDVVSRMLKAYGGEKNVQLLTSYVGRGFRKQLPAGHVATNYPFDIFQRKMDYKTKTYRIVDGEVADVQVLVVNGEEHFSWSRSTGRGVVPEWEVEMIGYRFPMILERLGAGDLKLELVESPYWDGQYHVMFEERDNIVNVGLDEKSFLVRQVTISSSADTSFSFKEEYGEYVKTDGIWFPDRFTGYYKDFIYYEFLVPVVSFGVEFADDAFRLTESDTAAVELQ